MPVSPESLLISGPPKSMISQTKLEEDVVTLTPNGHSLVSEHEPARSHHSTPAELHPETQPVAGLVNGSKSDTHTHTHTQIQNPQTSKKDVPNHYRLNIQLTPDTQQERRCSFPYQFETEI